MQGSGAQAGTSSGTSPLVRALLLVVLAGAAALVVLILLDGDSRHRYSLMFENGGQLVAGNEVLVAGQPVGIVEDVVLTDDAQARVDIATDDPLREGTSAVIRLTSLSGIANRYVALSLGPNDAPELGEGATITGERTQAPVEVDQFFDMFDAETRASLRDVIEGQATVYDGNTAAARRTYRFFAPSLQASERLFAELNSDQQALSEFLVSGDRVIGAVAERRDELSQLTENANLALGAIAAENEALDRSLQALPPAMRQANTTFVNLRAALDDLDLLVATAKPATRNLAPFLRDVRPVASRAVPVLGDLRLAVNRPGADNDLAEILELTPEVADRAGRAVPRAIRAMNRSEDDIAFARPYTPDLLAALTHLGQATAFYDANGHYARVQPGGANLFAYDGATLEPIPPENQYDGYVGPNRGPYTRCPGGATQTAADGSNPYLDDGRLAGDCDPLDLPPSGLIP